MIQYIDASLEAYCSLKLLVLTGGEAFIYGKKLEEIVRYAASKGLMTRIVSNGFWAKDYDKAYKRIESLIKAGLTEINFSTGDDHLEFVPIETIKNGALASLRQGLTVAINVESAKDRKFDSNFFLKDPDLKEYLMNGKLMVMNGLWIPFVEATETNTNENENSDSKKKIAIIENYTRCKNLFVGITIDPNHRLTACCGITSKYIEYLDLGDVRQFSIKELYDRQFNDFMKIWLATEGAHKIMDFIAGYCDIDESYKTEHACQVCEKILGNPQYLQIVKENHRKIYTNTLLKYFINKKEYETT
jgi:MoaA/NifB/PqqE/SkfB family radical SAM enzyme